MLETVRTERVGDVEHLAQAPEILPRIVAVLPRGEAIRNFVYTKALDLLAAQSDLSVISVFPTEEMRGLLDRRYGAVHELIGARDPWIVRMTRELLDLAHGRWLWSEAAKERWRLRDLEADTPKGWIKRRAKKMACYPFANRTGLELLSKAEIALSGRFPATERYIELFRKLKPAMVFNGSHVHGEMALHAVRAARALGIPVATFIFSWDNLTSQGRIIPPYDYYFVWNEAIKEQLLGIYGSIRPDQVFVTGTPQFDFHFDSRFEWTRERFCREVGADPRRPIVLYSTGMANHMPGEPRIVEGIARMLREMTDLGSPQLLVRVYPKDTTGRFDEIRDRLDDVLFPPVPWDAEWLTPRPEDNYILTNTLRHAAVGINVASTISLELCMFDRPVINVGYNPPGMDISPVDYARYYEFDHYRPVVESGAVEVAWSEAELAEKLRHALMSPETTSASRQRFVSRMFGDTLDGGSASRLVASLLELAGRR